VGSRRGFALIFGTVVVLAAAATVALGQGSTATKPLRACVAKKSGAIRLVAAARRCRHTEHVVTWNIRGKAGEPGPAGADGAPGANGSTGQPGADGTPGTFDFDSFDGMECDAGSGADTIDVTYDSDGFATFTC
jgi:hypothetical protein